MTTDPVKLALDFDEVRDVTVIGAGPVGICTAFWAGMREASSRVIDSLPELGGQLTTLYPEKWIFDVPGHPKVLARAVHEIRPEVKIQPKYSTNTGVPGVVAGQA
jgi:ferredoxin/flavodoxin---NADP+ reductase